MDDIIKKIQKLLALSKSSNQAEAELAAIKANELLLKYKLSLSDIEETEESLAVVSYGDVFIKMHRWKLVILQAISSTNGCGVSIETSGQRKRFKIVGEETNVKITKMTVDYLLKAIERISKGDIPKMAKSKYRDDFKFGMARGISSRLYNSVTEVDPSARALVIKSCKKVQDYFKGMALFDEPFKKENETAFQKGLISSKKIQLNKQCDAHSKERLA